MQKFYVRRSFHNLAGMITINASRKLPFGSMDLKDSLRQLSGTVLGCFLIIPWHPILRVSPNLRSIFLKCREVIKGVDFSKAAGVDQAHKKITDICAVFGLIE